MKSVLISIQPKWCELIASGKKTIEVRKTKPKIETPFKVYIYCTVNGDKLFIIGDKSHQMNGKVIGEFICDRIEDIVFSPYNHGEYICKDQSFIAQSCIPFYDMFDYLGEEYGYGWHISNLVIYDEPRELSEFSSPEWFRDCEKQCSIADYLLCPIRDSRKADKVCGWCRRGGKPITRSPQSWCYVEE